MYYNPLIPSNYSNIVSTNHVIRTGEVLVANRGLQHLNCILPQQGTKGALYLGDIVSTLKTELLERHQIKSILSCMVEPISSSALQKYITNHKILPIRDTLQFPILQYFNQSRQFIHQARLKGHNVLVHCHAGVSRSAAIVCAYLMHQNFWDFEKAIQFIREKRYRAKPNVNFVQQLVSFYNEYVLIQGQKLSGTIAPQRNPSVKTTNKITSFKITLDEEKQTHSELLTIQERQLEKKNQNNKFISCKIQSKQENQLHKFHAKRPIFDNTHHKLLDGQSHNKSAIHFHKAYDSNVKKVIRQDKVDGKGMQKKLEINQMKFSRGKLYDIDVKNDMMSKSMLNVKIPSQSGSYVFPENSLFSTPHKQKPISVNFNSSTLLRNIPNHYEPVNFEQVHTPTVHPGQKNNIDRFSLTGNLTSYKQCY